MKFNYAILEKFKNYFLARDIKNQFNLVESLLRESTILDKRPKEFKQVIKSYRILKNLESSLVSLVPNVASLLSLGLVIKDYSNFLPYSLLALSEITRSYSRKAIKKDSDRKIKFYLDLNEKIKNDMDYEGVFLDSEEDDFLRP